MIKAWPLILTSLLAIIAGGCMESVLAPDSESRSIEVSTSIRLGNTTQPLPNVTLDLYDVPVADDASPVATQTTSSQGVAELRASAPPTGRNYRLVASYNGQVRVADILLCGDTALAFDFSATVSSFDTCGVRRAGDTLRFVDDGGKERLSQGTPAGVERYYACWSTSFAPSLGAVAVTIPSNLPAPFTITGVYVDGDPVSTSGQVQIPAGGTLSICFAASTRDTGDFTVPFDIGVLCNGAQGGIRLVLRATVVERECACPSDSIPDASIEIAARTPIGTTADIEKGVFTNTLSCAVTIDEATLGGADAGEWTILLPAFPTTVQPGATLSLKLRFAPRSAGRSNATVRIRVRPPNGSSCSFTVDLEGNACSSACPELEASPAPQQRYDNVLVDTLLYRGENRVPLSAPGGGFASTAEQRYTFTLSDTACDPVTFTVAPTYPNDPADNQWITSSPGTFTLSPGESRTVTVTFTSPPPDEFDRIADRRRGGGAPSLKDSIFVIQLRVAGGTCVYDLRSVGIVSRCPGIATNLKLNGYAQRTSLINTPLQEIFTFATLTKDRIASGTPPLPYPPDRGDIYVDVDDNNPTAAPREPVLRLVPGSSFTRIGLWQTNYSNDRFENDACGSTLNDFCATTGSITWLGVEARNLQAGSVYVFEQSPGLYALVYIRETHNGTENNSNKQSSLEFAALYPVICIQ